MIGYRVTENAVQNFKQIAADPAAAARDHVTGGERAHAPGQPLGKLQASGERPHFQGAPPFRQKRSVVSMT